jgi:hypothetical protein
MDHWIGFATHCESFIYTSKRARATHALNYNTSFYFFIEQIGFMGKQCKMPMEYSKSPKHKNI